MIPAIVDKARSITQFMRVCIWSLLCATSLNDNITLSDINIDSPSFSSGSKLRNIPHLESDLKICSRPTLSPAIVDVLLHGNFVSSFSDGFQGISRA